MVETSYMRDLADRKLLPSAQADMGVLESTRILLKEAADEIDRLRSRNEQLEGALREAKERCVYVVAGWRPRSAGDINHAREFYGRLMKLVPNTSPPDSEPAEGEGSDRVPQCSCTTKTPDWRHHDVGCNYRIYMEDSFPPQREGEPTVRKSLHGGYVWTYCDECGPDVKVDEDGLCLACGRNAVYFGKKHPDDTPPQSRDAGDILREKLSDPKAMQRVTERAAERQDAMLERRDALEVVDEVERYGHASHGDLQKFRANCNTLRYLLSRTSDEGTGYNEVAGEVYQAVGVLLSDAGRFDDPDGIALLDACSYLAGNRDNPPDSLLPFESKGTGCVVPEAVKVLPNMYRRKGWDLAADMLEAAIAEQGGQR